MYIRISTYKDNQKRVGFLLSISNVELDIENIGNISD